MFQTLHLDAVVNSVVIYLFLIVGLRMLGKKELGQLSVADLIFIMLISNAVGDVMRSQHDTLLGGLVAAVSLILVNLLLKIADYKSKGFSRFLEGRPAILIRNGEINRREMRKNRITIDELEQAGRENGVGDLSQIKLAILEKDGKVSILDDANIRTEEPLEE